jgi:hypothetical protein
MPPLHKTIWLFSILFLLSSCAASPKKPAVSQNKLSPEAQSNEMQVPFAISSRKDRLGEMPADFWNSQFRFSTHRGSETTSATETSVVEGRVYSHQISKNLVRLRFCIDRAERSEHLPQKKETSIVTVEQSALMFRNVKFALTYNLETKSVSGKKGFAEVQKKINKTYDSGSAQDFFLNGLLNSLIEDPLNYFNFWTYGFHPLQTRKPGDTWTLDPGANDFGFFSTEQSFAGWTENEDGKFAIFTSKAKPVIQATQALTGVPGLNAGDALSDLNGSFGMNQWLLIRSDWLERKSRIEIRQSMTDPGTHEEIKGISSIDFEVSPLTK